MQVRVSYHGGIKWLEKNYPQPLKYKILSSQVTIGVEVVLKHYL